MMIVTAILIILGISQSLRVYNNYRKCTEQVKAEYTNNGSSSMRRNAHGEHISTYFYKYTFNDEPFIAVWTAPDTDKEFTGPPETINVLIDPHSPSDYRLADRSPNYSNVFYKCGGFFVFMDVAVFFLMKLNNSEIF